MQEAKEQRQRSQEGTTWYWQGKGKGGGSRIAIPLLFSLVHIYHYILDRLYYTAYTAPPTLARRHTHCAYSLPTGGFGRNRR